MAKATYKDAGVDLEQYADAMARLPRLIGQTLTPRVKRWDNGFAGLFHLDFRSPLFARNYDNPLLVACTDGVGTKLKVASALGVHNTVGIDLVAMCVNDALCCGAEPLFFLDYVALPQDNPALLEQLVAGITTGCLEADCSLLGGETAILPDLYAPGDYDLAGFCVGVVDEKNAIDGSAIVPDDVLVGLASSGLHSNGYSLARKIVFDIAGLDVGEHVEELGETVGQAMLRPTRIYTRAVRQVLNYYRVKSVVHGIAHITGGGLLENLARIVPDGIELAVRRGSWPAPAVFDWLQRLGGVEQAEMDRVFNMGLGLVLVVSPFYAESIRQQLRRSGLESWIIGTARSGPKGTVWDEK